MKLPGQNLAGMRIKIHDFCIQFRIYFIILIGGWNVPLEDYQPFVSAPTSKFPTDYRFYNVTGL